MTSVDSTGTQDAGTTKHIAVFGDTHGHLRLMLQLCRVWQLNHETHLDGVLQCGDFGFFPDVTRIDKATKSYAKRDPEELGFATYFAPNAPEADELVELTLLGLETDLDTIRCPIVFCHGNHEDFEQLETAVQGRSLAPVDRYKRFQYLPTGETCEVAGITVAAIGGGPEPKGDKASPAIGKFASHAASRPLASLDFDVLMCHGAPRGIGGESDEWGSTVIREVVQSAQPSHCFFAHHRERIAPTKIGQTECFWHNDVNFTRQNSREPTGPVEPFCMGVLQVDAEGARYEYVDASWFRALTAATWRHY